MAYTHNSKVAKSEPSWGSVDKAKLPDNAFAGKNAAGKPSYPHHWVSGGTMYLHRGGLAAALQAAGGARSGKQASPAIKAHLNVHKKALGMGDEKKKTKQSEQIQIDVNALHIVDPVEHALEFKAEEGDKPRQFKMIGYSGGIIKGHWYWGNLAIDLDGFIFNKPKYPILRDHITSQELGFSTKPYVKAGEGLTFTEKNTTLLETDEAKKFIDNSIAGFPYQASISGRPLIIERVAEGESTKVNGLTLKGPGTVWRRTEYKECSICVFGYDDKTQAQVFSSSGEHMDIAVESIRTESEQTNEMEVFGMDLKKLKEESPDEYEMIMAEIKAEAAEAASAEFQAQLDEKDKLISSLTADKDTLSGKLQTTEDRVLSLEKKDALREEADMDHKARMIWQTALAKSGLPEWLYSKVQKHVQRVSFMAEGVFNEAAFTEAVKAEITDWESHDSGQVEGFALIERTPEGGLSDKFKGDAIVDRMLGYVGQTSKAAN